MIIDWGYRSEGSIEYQGSIAQMLVYPRMGSAVVSTDCATVADLNAAILNLLDVQEVSPGITVREALGMISKTLKTNTYLGLK